ncbi:MAG: sigma-54-dependent Fis family transcriptional regulator [Desulfovibrionaceae bacterium]|jgi:DNA-binding NtrC family response regulator|nr:sigma-54-dependent Fis family transcriptional regulator [Desulfovibrionaceae bacterium]
MRILIVDDSENSLQGLGVVLQDLGYDPVPCRSAEEALEAAEREAFPLVITDIRMPGMDGIELLARLKADERSRLSDIVIITGHGDMETAIEALRKGAYDYLNKPINARELAAIVRRSAEHQALLRENRDWRKRFTRRVDEATEEVRRDLDRVRDQLRSATGIGSIVAQSQAMRRLVEETRLYHSNPEVPVLLEGETGTGKEVLARLIHFGERGNDAPFVAINCSAIPANLFESELFGHAPGAYTGSTRKGAQGKLELAGTGTLFLDEVAEMPLELQPKLLRVLESRRFFRVGGVREVEFQARVICAANRNLDELVTKGSFRRDLYHRLKVGHMVIPPLRQRTEDLAPLAQNFLEREAVRKRKRFQAISLEALHLLAAHDWPGNVRELENTIERAVLTCDDVELKPEHVAFLTRDSAAAPPAAAPSLAPGRMTLPDDRLDLEELIDTVVRLALEKCRGNKSRTAEYLGISRFALHRRLQKDR